MKYLDENDGVFKDAHDSFNLRWMKMLEEYSNFSLFLADFTPDLKIIKFTQFPSHLKKLTYNREVVGRDEMLQNKESLLFFFLK